MPLQTFNKNWGLIWYGATFLKYVVASKRCFCWKCVAFCVRFCVRYSVLPHAGICMRKTTLLTQHSTLDDKCQYLKPSAPRILIGILNTSYISFILKLECWQNFCSNWSIRSSTFSKINISDFPPCGQMVTRIKEFQKHFFYHMYST